LVTSCVGTRRKHFTEEKIEGRIEVTRRRGRGRKKLQDGLKKRRGYLKLKDETADNTL
jgi:hypothetical protein